MISRKPRKYCECGCGQILESSKRFINFHSKRGVAFWKKQDQPSLCECGCGNLASPGKRFVLGHHVKGKGHPFYGKFGKDHPMYGKASDIMKKAWQNPEYRENKIESSKAMWERSGYRKEMSEAGKARWQDPEFVKNQMIKRHVRQNKAEKQLEQILNDLHPNEWKFVGDGELIISGKCPDFVNVNGQKKLIELFGDYWHKGQDPEDRIKVFKPFGFETLIVWESELKDIKSLRRKLMLFDSKGKA